MKTTLHAPEQLRNIGIAAHIDAGKTTLTERILYYAGAIHHCGDVHDGNTATDFSQIEKSKGITISAAAAPCFWTPSANLGLTHLHAGEPHRLNLIDTPGHVDFTAEVERSLRVLDGSIAVFCAVGGVQPQSETVWRQMDRYHVPRIAFINKMDRVGANFDAVVQELREKLKANAWPVLLPLGAETDLCGQLDVIDQCALRYADPAHSTGGYEVTAVPEAWREKLLQARIALVNALADLDDEVAALWLEERPISAEVLKHALRRQTLAGRIVPVIGGSAYRHIGVQALVDAVVDYLPSPDDVDVNRLTASVSKSTSDPPPPLAALAFKVVRHPLAGRLVYVRVYAGRLEKGQLLVNPRTHNTERCGRLLRVFADRRDELEQVHAGDICAVAGLREFTTGDTLCLTGHELSLEPPQFPEPVISMAIEPARSSDQAKLSAALAKLSDEDPSFRIHTDAETGECVISGMGELHLEIIREKLRLEHDLETVTGAPEIACRETITQQAEADHQLKKQNGGIGMFARVKLELQPLARGQGLHIQNAVVGGVIPTGFMNAVHRGIQEAATAGTVAGSPVCDLQVRVIDGAYHTRDSNEQAFRLAAGEAFRKAFQQASPVLLEPVMAVECSVAEDCQGDILSDLNRRRARILNIEHSPSQATILAEVPLVEMFGYAGAIRSLSRGRASYSMSPTAYEIVPEAMISKLIHS